MSEPRTLRRRPAKISGPTPAVTAYHEAGHFVAAYVQRRGDRDYSEIVSIVPHGRGVLGVHAGEDPVGEQPSRVEIEAAIVQAYAGYAAEVRYAPDRHQAARHTARGDEAHAEVYLDWLGLKGSKNRKEREERRHSLRDRARFVIEKYWAAVTALAEELLEHKRLDGEEAEWIVQIAIGAEARKGLARWRALRDLRQDQEHEESATFPPKPGEK